jgi:hypothetical protein
MFLKGPFKMNEESNEKSIGIRMLWAGWSGVQILLGARFSTPIALTTHPG